MPIYEYRCEQCGFQKEHLQKVSDALLTQCPQCGQASYKKMLTAAGFQLKGTGWYATDFKGNGGKPATTATATTAKTGDAAPASTPAAESKSDSAPAAAPAAAPASGTT